MDDRLWLHEDVLNGIEGRPHLGKRLGIVLQQIAALGRTTIVKGCSDISNRGWLRTPLGGASGMHYYLWWTREGSAQCKSMEPGPNGSIFLRTVRHHDNYKPLRAGRRADYHQLTTSDLGDEASGSFETPWTETQEQFTLDDGAIRVVHGYPGSGKTMALWRAIESREGNKTLYLWELYI